MVMVMAIMATNMDMDTATITKKIDRDHVKERDLDRRTERDRNQEIASDLAREIESVRDRVSVEIVRTQETKQLIHLDRLESGLFDLSISQTLQQNII